MHCGEHKTVVLVEPFFSLVTSAGFAAEYALYAVLKNIKETAFGGISDTHF